jgi:hypothetical protein
MNRGFFTPSLALGLTDCCVAAVATGVILAQGKPLDVFGRVVSATDAAEAAAAAGHTHTQSGVAGAVAESLNLKERSSSLEAGAAVAASGLQSCINCKEGRKEGRERERERERKREKERKKERRVDGNERKEIGKGLSCEQKIDKTQCYCYCSGKKYKRELQLEIEM